MSAPDSASVWPYYGPLFLGGVSATLFSGMTAVQAAVYVKLYPKDPNYMKALVLVVWAIDVAQTGLTWNALWFYLIDNFGDPTKFDDIPVAFTMAAISGWIIIMLVHSCYLHRIFCLSNRNVWITVPIGILMTVRLSWVIGSTIEMFHLQKWSLITTEYKWLITLGLSFSTSVDLTITICLIMLLCIRSRSCLRVGNQVIVLSSFDGLLDSLILYTLEIGSVTGIASILSLVCWLTLSNHMVFVGFYISFGKLYANCLMAMLNMRYSLRRQHPMTTQSFTDTRVPSRPQVMFHRPRSGISSDVQLESVTVDVSKATQCESEEMGKRRPVY